MTLAVVLAIVTPLLSFAGAWGGVSARLRTVEQRTERAHERIDEHLNQHLEGTV